MANYDFLTDDVIKNKFITYGERIDENDSIKRTISD